MAKARPKVEIKRCDEHEEDELPAGEFFPCCVATAAMEWIGLRPASTVDDSDLGNLLYTLSEGSRITEVSNEDALTIWRAVDKLRRGRLPKELVL